MLVLNLLWRKHSWVQVHIRGEQRGRVTAEPFHGSASAPPVPSSYIFGCGLAISREISWLSLHQALFCSPLKLGKSRDILWFGLRSPYALEPHFRMWTSNLA
jgi:hypothetical protein